MSCSPLHLTPPLILISFLLSSLALSGAVTVTHLPGYNGRLPFHLETGYVNVDETNGVELFYYFIPSDRSPLEDPVILWLTGGPGCSAFSGLVIEIGPMKFVSSKYNGSIPNLVYNPYSWTKISNIIFLDSPVGSGFSYARNAKGYEVGDISSSKQAYKFLRKWFLDHPHFLSNPLYIAGDSYAGKVVPVVAQEISQGVEAEQQPVLNLKGYMIGNPSTGEKIDFNSRVPYANGMGIISDELKESIERSCEGEDYGNPHSAVCSMKMDIFDKFTSEIETSHILEPLCPLASPKPRGITRRSIREEHSELVAPPPVPALSCRSYTYYLAYYWANNNLTREALHVKKGTVKEWVRCNWDLPYTYDVPSSIKYHLNLTTRGYRALVYSGDHDLLVPFIGTELWIKSLRFPIVDDWRSWHVGGQVAGYTRAYSNNLTFATVKGAGHTAPEYRPKECLAMLQRWISNEPL